MNSIKNNLKTMFSLDLRALAIFRVGLGLLLIVDTYYRALDAVAFYTDVGVLPRSKLLESSLWLTEHWSLHLISGEAWFIYALLALAFIFALGVLTGTKTRLSLLISWILLVSIDARNPIVLQGGDIFLRLLIFWALFLPLGAKFSVDEALSEQKVDESKKSVLSIGTFALFLQFTYVFFHSGLLKRGVEWTTEGNAIYYALSLDQFALPLGRWLREFPDELRTFTPVVRYFEIFGAFLLWIPHARIRALGVLAFYGLALGFGSCLKVGPFPYVIATAASAFIPGFVFDSLSRHLRKNRESLEVYYDGDCGFCRKMVAVFIAFFRPSVKILKPAQSDPRLLEFMKAQNSWIVRSGGETVVKDKAVFKFIEASPYFRLLRFLLRPLPMRRIYEWIADHRTLLGRCTRPFSWKPQCPAHLRLNKLEIAFVLFAIFLSFYWNLRLSVPGMRLPREIRSATLYLKLDQYWNMFAPYPSKDGGFYVMPGVLTNGKEVDVFTEKPVIWDEPEGAYDFFPRERWHKYLMNLWSSEFRSHISNYAGYVCRKWNASHYQMEEKLDHFEIFFILEKSLPPGQPQTQEKISLWKHGCFQVPPPPYITPSK